jgi:Fe2+ or Zn2+ uptake regulation protein
MELSGVEKMILDIFDAEGIMTLKMITNRIKEGNPSVSKQSVWNALQLLMARNLVKKIDRGVYSRV